MRLKFTFHCFTLGSGTVHVKECIIIQNCVLHYWFHIAGGPDACADDPCLNDGTCINFIDYYECECPESYTGDHCEIGNTYYRWAGKIKYHLIFKKFLFNAINIVQ